MVLEIFKIADVEGEDYNLEELIPEKLVQPFKQKLGELLKLPPRMVIARLYRDSKWHNKVVEAAKIHIIEKMKA